MPRLSARAKAQVYSKLEKYARSGMGMDKACDSLLGQPRLPAAERRLYRSLREGLRQGRSIGDALGSADDAVSPLEREVVSAAESGGKLEKGFAHLAEYFRRLDRVRRRIAKGLAYPLVLVHLAIPVTGLAVAAFRGFRLDGSAPEGGYRAALVSSGWAVLTLWGLLLLGFGAVSLLHRFGRSSAPVDALLGRVPLLGNVRKALAMERFAQVFEILLLAGRRMSDALSGAALASGSGRIRAAGRRGAATVAAGQPLSAALFAEPGAFPGDFARGMAAAEEAGQLDRELAEWGRLYSESAAESMERLSEWTPKLFYWGVLLFVAVLIVRAALAYRDLLDGLLNFGW